MITLEKEFVSNYDKSGNNKFIQVKRNNKAAVYRREKMDGKIVGFEVFKIKVQPAGTKFPNGVVTTEDQEKYPTANVFGKWAWFVNSEIRANVWFDRISADEVVIPDYNPETGEVDRPENDPSLEEVMNQPDKVKKTSNKVTQTVTLLPMTPTSTVEPKKRGRKPKNLQPIEYKIPEGEFDRTAFAKFNDLPFEPVDQNSYVGIKSLIEKGLIIKAREQYTGSRPKSIYKAV